MMAAPGRHLSLSGSIRNPPMPETCPSAAASVSVFDSAAETLRRLTECIAERGLSPAEVSHLRPLATQLLDEVERAAVLVGRGFVPDLVAYAEERWTEAEY